MNKETKKLIENYVNENVNTFHENRVAKLTKLSLKGVLRNKNPYLFKAKNLNFAPGLMTAILDARLSSSEEGTFGGFLENVARFVAENTGGALKSLADGIDIEIIRKDVRYAIAVKSGNNWGNAQQHAALRSDFKKAVKTFKQGNQKGVVQPTLGICYGNFKTTNNGSYLHIGGQSFWHLISGDGRLYIDMIEPLGYKAEQHDEAFKKEKDATYNRLIGEFIQSYCEPNGAINWPKLVEFVSGNM